MPIASGISAIRQARIAKAETRVAQATGSLYVLGYGKLVDITSAIWAIAQIWFHQIASAKIFGNAYMTYLDTNFYLFLENLIFFAIATAFCAIVGWAWRNTKPMTFPKPLPGWFKIWFGTVQVVGVLVPLVAMLLWGVLWGYTSVLTVFIWYFVMLGLQILSESVTLRQFQSVVWVMVPYLYLPYRIWQLYEGLSLLNPESELIWIRSLLILQIVLWTANYALDVSQLPRLFHWETQENKEIS